MSLVASPGEIAFSHASSTLSALATPDLAQKATPEYFSAQLKSASADIDTGIPELTNTAIPPRGMELEHDLVYARQGIDQLSVDVLKDPTLKTAPATTQALQGWADLTQQADFALYRT